MLNSFFIPRSTGPLSNEADNEIFLLKIAIMCLLFMSDVILNK